mmetsp:Transcript_45210/g.139473  ORF Transcript_45210/g.139473 Transcript_45210/m.139473 type:complete len:273 (+) Transcript_45210:261-1079(+)
MSFSPLTAPSRIGNASSTISTEASCDRAKLRLWPRMPKPVTSVHAWAPNSFMSAAALRFSIAMLATQLSYSASISATDILPSTPRRYSGDGRFDHCRRLTPSCVPSGFVRMSTSPATIFVGRTISDSAATLIATPPIRGHGLCTDWPPVTSAPASLHLSRKPRIMSRVTASRSPCGMSVEEAMSIRTLSQSTMPIAKRSDSTLAAPTAPWRYGSSTLGKKKSVVDTRKSLSASCFMSRCAALLFNSTMEQSRPTSWPGRRLAAVRSSASRRS